MGGISASGGPKNGISMASVDSVPTRNRYGMPKMVPTTATSAAWMPARITWVRRKPPKARPTLSSRMAASSENWRGTARFSLPQIRSLSISM